MYYYSALYWKVWYCDCNGKSITALGGLPCIALCEQLCIFSATGYGTVQFTSAVCMVSWKPKIQQPQLWKNLLADLKWLFDCFLHCSCVPWLLNFLKQVVSWSLLLHFFRFFANLSRLPKLIILAHVGNVLGSTYTFYKKTLCRMFTNLYMFYI